MQYHEAKILRAGGRIPQHMRDEAERIIKLHAALVAADRMGRMGHGGRPPPPTGDVANEFATLDPSLTLRINKVLIFNLLMACDNRGWLPAIRAVVTHV